ncbi:MAG: cell division protein SepF, partial [Candidatus Altiarchaeota archaeon]
EKNNIVVLNVKALLHNKVLLREIVKELRDACVELDGDLGKVSDEKILVVPQGMRIAHSEAPATAE